MHSRPNLVAGTYAHVLVTCFTLMVKHLHMLSTLSPRLSLFLVKSFMSHLPFKQLLYISCLWANELDVTRCLSSRPSSFQAHVTHLSQLTS
jgi:hypothetical protein